MTSFRNDVILALCQTSLVLERSCLGLANADFFVDTLYNSSSIPEAIDLYIDYLRLQDDGKSLLHANILQEYKEFFSSDTTMKLRRTFDGLYDILSKTHPNLRFRIAGRRKS